MTSYKELQAALKTAKAEGLTTVKLNSKQEVLQAAYDLIYGNKPEAVKEEALTGQATELTCDINAGYINTVHEYEYAYPLTCQYVAPPIQAKLNDAIESSCYPFCSNTVKVENKQVKEQVQVERSEARELFIIKVIPAMDNKYAPSWLCKPMTVYVIDGVDYLPHELEMNLQGQCCELPAVVNERKLQANLPPRLQATARKDRVSKARQPQPIINPAKDKPKVKCEYSKEPASPYFIDTAKAAKYSKSLGDVEKQAARNLEDAIRATKQGLRNVIDFGKGFHARQVERARKVAA